MGFGYVRESHESTPGNELNSPTLATKKIFTRLQEFTPSLNSSPLMRDDELINVDDALMVFPEKYDPTWAFKGRFYPDVMGYWLTTLFGLPTTTAGDGIITDPAAAAIPVGAYRHVWAAPGSQSGPFPKTFQSDVAYSTEAVYFKAKGCATSEFSIDNPDSGGVGVSRSGPCLFLDEQANPSLTPAYEAETLVPFLRSKLGLTWLSGSAQPADFTLAFSQEVQPVHNVGSGSFYPDEMYKGDSPITLSGSVPKQLIDTQDFAALKGHTAFAAIAAWIHTAIIASGYPYKLFIEMPNCQYTEGGPAALTNARRRGAQFSFKATRGASTPSFTVTLVNATTSYA